MESTITVVLGKLVLVNSSCSGVSEFWIICVSGFAFLLMWG